MYVYIHVYTDSREEEKNSYPNAYLLGFLLFVYEIRAK